MHRFVVLVDAGYLLSQAVTLVSGKQSKKRADLHLVNPAALIQHLVAAARQALSLPADRELLRVYWYDGVMSSGHSTQQKALMNVDDVLFRGGTVNGKGQQKGVDSLIVTDLIELAANHAIVDAMVITGDSDLAVGIDLAQRKGVRIAVMGVHDVAQGVAPNQSFEITSRADRVTSMGLTAARQFFTYVPRAAAPSAPAAAPTAPARKSAPAGQAAGPTANAQSGAPSPSTSPAASAVPTAAPASVAATPSASASPTQTPAAPAPTTSPASPAPASGAPSAVSKAPAQPPSRGTAALTTAVKSFIAAHPTEAATPLGSGIAIPQAVDRLLMHFVYEELGSTRISDDDRKQIRAIYRQEVKSP